MFEKEILGAVSVALTFVGYVPYIWLVLNKKTKPHVFSWIIWGIVNGIVFLGQYTSGGAAGSWVTGVTAGLCFLVVGLSLFSGEKYITRTDRISFSLALLTIPLWYFTKDALASVILATCVDVLGCYPTIRKAYNKPYHEPVFSWSIAGLRSFISLFALGEYSLVTTVFPVAMIFTNGGVAVLLLWRRHSLRGSTT